MIAFMSRRNKSKVNDAFSNPAFRIGYGTPAPLEQTEYPLTRLTENYSRLNAIYRGQGITQTVVDIIPEDMLREWYKLGGTVSSDMETSLARVERKTKIRDKIKDGLKWGRLFGGAVGIILIRGQEDILDKPLDLSTVLPGTFSGLYVLDRWSGVSPSYALVTDISDPDFNTPEYYDIVSPDGGLAARVHHSRTIRFVGRDLPLYEKVAAQYWGESELEPIMDDIVLYDNIMHNMGNLTFRANVDTMTVKNLDQLFAIGSVQQQQRFWDMMRAQSICLSNFGTRLVNDGETVSNTQYTFTGFNYVTEAAQLNLSAKTHIPVTKLFGQAPTGFNATGESDLKNYYDIVDGQRETKLRPVLEKLLPVMAVSAWGAVPDDLEISFPPLWTPTAAELSTIAQQKAATIVQLFQSGLIKAGAALSELKKLSPETGMFGSITDEDIEAYADKTYQDLTAMADPMAGLFETA